MLDRLRKRFENLLGAKRAPSVGEGGTDGQEPTEDEASTESSADLESATLARREAHKRESRLILSERIHNRAAVLLNELRSELLQEIHHRLDEEQPNGSLTDLLQVTLDPGFTSRMDERIGKLVSQLMDRLATEYADAEAKPLFPKAEPFANELKSYRDAVLRKHLLEQIEVLALPTSARAFPMEKASSDELKERIAQYWSSCREALDKFFRSVSMVLLDGAREGIRLQSGLIRERLLAAQYRNGYRLLEERFRSLYGEIARLQMSAEPMEKERAQLDRRVVDEIIVPLAYFIRERKEIEPREALASRAELFCEIVDKLVAVPEPFAQTAEAIKPVLRKSVEQARPLAVSDFPFLRAVVESLNPSALHRTTALVKVFETLVRPELDEASMEAVEQTVRLNRAQFRLYQQVVQCSRSLLYRVVPLDRVQDDDALFIADLIEQTDPPEELVEDVFSRLGYVEWPDPAPEDARRLLRLVALRVLPASELGSWRGLYQPELPPPEERARIASALVARIGRASLGAVESAEKVGAVPLPVDLGRTLAAMGYRPDDEHRLSTFRGEVEAAVESADAEALAEVAERLDRIERAVDAERVTLGVTGIEADPYLVEMWAAESGAVVVVLRYSRPGYGRAPIEVLSRDPAKGNRKEIEEKLRRQLQNQAIIYQTFHKLFSREALLPKEDRRKLPAYVKRLYEPAEANRLLLLSRLRYAKELVGMIEGFTRAILASEAAAAPEGKGVLQILAGLDKKVGELAKTAERSRDMAELARLVREYERAIKYLNTILVHSVNPWLDRQTADLGTEFEFRKDEVEQAVRRHVGRLGLDWDRDVEGFEAHGIRGTLGCRALMRLADGSSKVVLLNYDRRRQDWQVRHIGPRLTDVVREVLRQYGKTLPEDYDEKFEQPTFSLDEQSCRFLYVKRGVARVEATLVLAAGGDHNAWQVVYLGFNDQVLVDRLTG